MIRISIPGRIMTLNEYRNAHFRKLHAEKLKWQEIICWELKRLKIKPLNPPITITATSFTASARDCDGTIIGLKFFQDSLVEMGLLKDDSPTYIRPVILDWQKAKSRKEERMVFLIQ